CDLPHTPETALLPYTTLFRSLAGWIRAWRETPHRISELFARVAPLHGGVNLVVSPQALRRVALFVENERRHQCLEHATAPRRYRSEEHTSELQSRFELVCRLL